jgi:hypothetical protein
VIESLHKRDFPHPSRPAPRAPTQPPVQCTVSFLWIKRPGRGLNHPPPSSAEVKEKVDVFPYLPHPSGPLRPVLGRTLHFYNLFIDMLPKLLLSHYLTPIFRNSNCSFIVPFLLIRSFHKLIYSRPSDHCALHIIKLAELRNTHSGSLAIQALF